MAGEVRWRFLTNHAHVLLAVAAAPGARVADIAATVGISSRAALTILADLEDAGYLRRTRVGRRNHYAVSEHRPFRHPATAHHEVDELLAIFRDDGPRPAGRRPASPGGGAAEARPARDGPGQGAG
ncbi:helix-turn-helix transcriptional regulator [Geodermatophilus sp. SYSU D01105]